MSSPRPYANPYLAGVGLGLVLLGSFVVSGQGLGASGAFASIASGLVGAVAPGQASSNPYFSRYLADGPPWAAWMVVEVAGVIVGGGLSALLAGRSARRSSGRIAFARPATWAAAGGGVIMGVGAVLARGCTSGLALSGWCAAGGRRLGLHGHAVRRRLRDRAAGEEALAVTAPPPLLVAFAVGLAFGWSLERAGLGDARKLSGQFYLRDFTVLKVMMSAVLTAMLGAFWLSRLGVIDPAGLYVPPTFLLPQAVGGLIFGVGFVVSGLCPGTACVAAASGRGDGLTTAAGLLIGVLLAGLAMPVLRPFYEATPLGALTLPQLLHAPTGAVVAAVTVAGLVLFQLVRRLEPKA